MPTLEEQVEQQARRLRDLMAVLGGRLLELERGQVSIREDLADFRAETRRTLAEILERLPKA